MRPLFGTVLASVLIGCAAADAPYDRQTVASADWAGAADASRPVVEPTLAATLLGRSLRLMAEEDPVRRAGQAAERASLARLQEAASALRPSVGLQAEAGLSSRGDSDFSPVLRVSQRVYDGGAARSRIAAARQRVDVSRYEAEAALASRVGEAVRAWEDLHTARTLERLAKSSVARHQDIADRVNRRVAAGAGTNAEALRVASRRADAEARLAAAAGRRTEAETLVVEYFGQVPGVGALPKAPAPSADGLSNADILALTASRAAAERELEEVRARLWPAVFLDFTGQPGAGDDPALAAGFRLNYDFNVSGSATAAIEAAEAEVARLDAEIALARQDLTQASRSAAGRETSLARQLAAAEAAAGTAREALANADTQFSSGRVEIVDLLELGRDVDLAEARVAELSAAYRVAGYDRLWVSGEILAVFGICALACAP